MGRVLLLAFVLAGCATDYQRRMPAADDPANPDAPMTPVEPLAVSLAAEPGPPQPEPAPAAPATEGHEHHHHHGAMDGGMP